MVIAQRHGAAGNKHEGRASEIVFRHVMRAGTNRAGADMLERKPGGELASKPGGQCRAIAARQPLPPLLRDVDHGGFKRVHGVARRSVNGRFGSMSRGGVGSMPPIRPPLGRGMLVVLSPRIARGRPDRGHSEKGAHMTPSDTAESSSEELIFST